MPSSFTLWPRRQMTGVTTVKKKLSHKNQRASFPSGNEFLSTEEGMDRPILQTHRAMTDIFTMPPSAAALLTLWSVLLWTKSVHL